MAAGPDGRRPGRDNVRRAVGRREERLAAKPSDEDVSSFIRSTFRSVWALELPGFLRQEPGLVRSHDEMVAGLRGSDLVVTQSVESLTAAGLVVAEANGSARYSPASKKVRELAERSEFLYKRSPDAVRRMIAAAANPAIAAFAAAFWLLGLAQALLTFTAIPVVERSWLFLLRLAAFSLILVSIWRKNRRA